MNAFTALPRGPDGAAPAGESRFVSAPDGLRLHVRDSGPRSGAALPVVCLPGLARTAADFDVLAERLAAGRDGVVPRRVLALDYRGRGLSDRDPDPRNYDVRVEANDVLAVLAAAEVGDAILVGTSRGGLISMVLAALRPAFIKGVVLNDIGPVLEAKGLARIRGYVGKLPRPRSWADAVEILKGFGSAQFPALSEADWRSYAELTFEQRSDGFVARYDPALMVSLQRLDLSALPVLWPQFEALRHAPVLVLRGAHSDLLSPETALEMTRRHPDCALHVVDGQGHAPLLRDPPTLDRIVAFMNHCEARRASWPTKADRRPPS